jgi:hypothetical protein
MADQPFNIAKGRVVEWYNRIESNDPANSAFIIVLLKVAESDATLIDYDDLGALLGAAGNTEADFTNYARKVVTDSDLAALPAPDDTNNRFDIDMPDQVYSSAGGATNNTLVKAIICYDSDTTGGTDANIIPCAHYDFAVTTDGTDLTMKINAAGFYRAS